MTGDSRSRSPCRKRFFPFRRRCTLRPHSAAVNFLDFSRDGEFLLAASSDKSISLSAPLLGRHIASYGGSAYQAVVTCVSSGFGNASFLSTAADGRALLWDVETQQVLRAFPRQKGQLKACLLLDAYDAPRAPGQQQQQRSNACSDTRLSQVAVVAGEDRAVRFFDIRQKNRHLACLEQLHDAKDSITCLLFAGHSLLAGSADGCVYEYDIRKGRLHVDEIGQPVSSMSLSSEAESLLLGCADGYIRLQERASGEVLLALAGHASKLQHYRLDAHFTLLDSRRKSRLRLPLSSHSSAAAAWPSAAAAAARPRRRASRFPHSRRGGRSCTAKHTHHAQQQMQGRQQSLQPPLQQQVSLAPPEQQQQKEQEEEALLEQQQQQKKREAAAAAPRLAEEEEDCEAPAPSKHPRKGSSGDFVKPDDTEQQVVMETEEEEEERAFSHAHQKEQEARASCSSFSEEENPSDDYFSSSEDDEEGPPVYRLCVLSGSEDGALVGWDLQTAAAEEEKKDEQKDKQQQQRGCMVIRKRIHAHPKRPPPSPAAAAAGGTSLPSAAAPLLSFSSLSASAAAAAVTLSGAAVASGTPSSQAAAAAQAFTTAAAHVLPQQQEREPVALLSLRLEETRGLMVTGASDGVIKVWKKR